MRTQTNFTYFFLAMLLTGLLGSHASAQTLQVSMTGASTGVPLSLTTATVVNQTCVGAANGQISVTMAGGSPTYTYSWFDNPTANAATRTGLTAGTYTIEGTDAAGCKKTLNITLGTTNTASTNPTAASASVSAICSGTSTTLNLTGGSVGTGAVIKWYSGTCGGTLVGTGNGLVVSPATTTTYYGRYEGLCNTTTCASVTVTVNPYATATISATNTPVCRNAASPLVTFTGSGGTKPYTFTYKIGNGTPKTISTTGTNSSVTLAVSTVTATTFIYTLLSVSNGTTPACPNNITGQTATAVINPVAFATISPTTATPACLNGTSPVIITGSNTPTAGRPYIFTYKRNNIAQPNITTNATLAQIPMSATGQFTYEVTYVNNGYGCGRTITGTKTGLITVTNCAKTLIDKEDNADLTVIETNEDVFVAYPNPTDGLLNVDIDKVLEEGAQLMLYDASGKSVWQKDILFENGKANEQLDLSNLAVGVYYLIFQTENSKQVKKVVKE